MIERIILKFKNQGFKNFYISINYLGHMIKNYLGKGDKLGVSINYVHEKIFRDNWLLFFVKRKII